MATETNGLQWHCTADGGLVLRCRVVRSVPDIPRYARSEMRDMAVDVLPDGSVSILTEGHPDFGLMLTASQAQALRRAIPEGA